MRWIDKWRVSEIAAHILSHSREFRAAPKLKSTVTINIRAMWKAFSPLLFDGMALTGARRYISLLIFDWKLATTTATTEKIKVARFKFRVFFHFIFRDVINSESKD